MKKLLFGLLIGVSILILIVNKVNWKPAVETITFFPIDPSASFRTANTSLTLTSKNPAKQYEVDWKIQSDLDRKAYIRQDLGFLFANGKLIATVGDWKQNTSKSIQQQTVKANDSSLFQAIIFHYAELHQKDVITSAQQLSGDYLYVIDSTMSPLQSFRTPFDKDSADWKKVIDKEVTKELQESWRKAAKFHSINLSSYDSIPLTDLLSGKKNAFQSLPKRKKQRVLGNLWEGLYKNYFLGIKKANGKMVSPINSTMPLILLAKDNTHLLVLFETSDGEPIVLRQAIPAS
ncbi:MULTISPECIES: hypothetical protein [unclassified Bacillus (in: firmicutes)]|uniref:hypothetical protein n=1 Tax=unclassified Bacillus (in: firmicutes) TaxID=185979 RepID=UPI0008F27749|nr:MULTISPECIES: hypothetical protein [unclassified Bacillus (in: firmicutes)]SFA96225.1 hypothetical protein SAMN02799634_103153 [Bacillus sp. UNCCL13]SFQ79670.1 hypothetical protein SAMN04488577_1786 [Bacillus sp. cl95]